MSVEGAATRTVIDVCVAGDHETFDSPTAFTELVTVDALRHFSSISAVVTAGDDRCEILLRWNRPWWSPGSSKDADVIVEVTGPDGQIEARHELIQQAMLRGGTQREAIQAITGLFLATAAAGVAATFVISGGFLLGVDATTTTLIAFAIGLVGWVLGIFWGTWAYPSIEVAPIGQTNLRRIIRVVGPVLLTVILAGATKKLFG
jgi:hypothetical protein